MEPLRWAGWLLVVGGTIALIGACTPPYKQWYSPLPVALQVIAEHQTGWRVINSGFLAGTVIASIGLGLAASGMRLRPSGGMAIAGAVSFAAGTLFWVLNLAFRLTVMAWAADRFAATGAIPDVFVPLHRQASLFFALFAVFAFPAVAAVGSSVLANGVAPRWVGWTMVVVGLIGAPIVVLVGPWMLYVPIVLLGAALALNVR